MRIARFRLGADAAPLTGVVLGDRVHELDGLGGPDVLDVACLPVDERDALGSRAQDSPGHALADVHLLPPVQPPTIRDFVSFEEHVEGVARSVSDAGDTPVAPEWFGAPAFYFSNPYAVIGAHDDVEVPPGCQALDFELEVAAVIGTAGRDLTGEQGAAAIVGYTILNDWSARDLQRVEMRVGLGPAKGKDSATTLGPWLTTADELEPHVDGDGFLALPMTVAIDGEMIGTDLLSNMGWPFGDLVAYASRGTWVRPGDVIGSGTCGNGGCLAELWGRRGEQLPPPLRIGQTVTMTVGGLGSIANRVVPGRPVIPIPAARTRSRARPATAASPGQAG